MILFPWIGNINATSNFYLLSFPVLIIMSLYFYFLPLQCLVVRHIKDEEIDLELFNFNKLKWSKRLVMKSYWWNYTEIKDVGDNGIRQLEANPNHPKNTGTGSMDSSGIPTEITLYIKLEDKAGNFFYLFEEKGNWASIPAWPYQLDKVEEGENAILCKRLKRLIRFLEV